MATALRPVGHEERLTLVDHLDELRTRLIICVAALVVTAGFCYWQNGTVLHILNKPLDSKEQSDSSKNTGDPLEQQSRFGQRQRNAYLANAALFESLKTLPGVTPAQSRLIDQAIRTQKVAAASVPKDITSNPITLGVTEPFTQTLSVAFYAGLLLALPLLLYQIYAFVHPGVHAARAQGRRPADVHGAGPVPVRRRLRLLRRAATGHRVPAELQRRQLRHPGPGQHLLQVLHHLPGRDRPAVPDPRRDPGRHARRDRHAQAAAQGTRLRDPGDRRHRGRSRTPHRRIRSP